MIIVFESPKIFLGFPCRKPDRVFILPTVGEFYQMKYFSNLRNWKIHAYFVLKKQDTIVLQLPKDSRTCIKNKIFVGFA